MPLRPFLRPGFAARRTVLWAFWAASSAACLGNQTNGFGPEGGATGGSGADLDPSGSNAPASTVGLAAALQPWPELTGDANAVVAAPKIYVVDLGDAGRAAFVGTFLQAWGSSPEWAAMLGEYGVGAPTLALPTAVSPAWQKGAAYADTVASPNASVALAQIFADPNVRPVDGNTLAVLVVPRGVTLRLDPNGAADACADGVAAWHGAAHLGTGNALLPYVVLPACTGSGALQPNDLTTLALSHAVVGALTDPQRTGYNSLASTDAFWRAANAAPEVGALCGQLLADSDEVAARPTELGYLLHRTWSNAQARRGAPPCVPQSSNEVVLQLQPQGMTTAQLAAVDDPNDTSPVDAVFAAPGQTTAVPLQLFVGDGRLAGASVVATEVGSSALTLSVDPKGAGTNALTVLQVTVPAAPTQPHYLVRVSATRGRSSAARTLLVVAKASP